MPAAHTRHPGAAGNPHTADTAAARGAAMAAAATMYTAATATPTACPSPPSYQQGAYQRPGMKSDIGTQKKKVIFFGQIDFFSRKKSIWPKQMTFFFWVPMPLFIPGR